MKTYRNKSIIYIRDVTPGVRNQFKSVVYRRGDTMQEVVEALLRYYTRNPEKVDDDLLQVKAAKAKRKKLNPFGDR